MTPKEANKILEMFLHKQCDLKRTEFAYNQNEVWQAVDMANSALEKQIQKKPIEDISKDYEGNIIDDVFFCPKCTRTICFGIENNLAENYPYCNCGQALDWSDSK